MAGAAPLQGTTRPDERRILGTGHPDYEFPKEVHNLLVAAYEGN